MHIYWMNRATVHRLTQTQHKHTHSLTRKVLSVSGSTKEWHRRRQSHRAMPVFIWNQLNTQWIIWFQFFCLFVSVRITTTTSTSTKVPTIVDVARPCRTRTSANSYVSHWWRKDFFAKEPDNFHSFRSPQRLTFHLLVLLMMWFDAAASN